MKYIKILEKFSLPIFVSSILLTIFGLLQGSALVFLVYPYILLLCTTVVLISIARKLARKNWIQAIIYTTAPLVVFFLFYVMFYPRDLFFSNLSIPQNIRYKQPIELISKSSGDSLISLQSPGFKMELANYGQPGMYKSFIWAKPGEKGILYLKAYDALYNFELERISKRTEIEIEDPGKSSFSQEFTVYDGVWGKYYLARFELWFTPDKGFPERKIGEQTFKVEGWIR